MALQSDKLLLLLPLLLLLLAHISDLSDLSERVKKKARERASNYATTADKLDTSTAEKVNKYQTEGIV